MTKYKQFNWEECNHSEPMKRFLKSVQNSGISKEKFIKEYRKVPYDAKNGTRSRSKARNNCQARCEYENLDEVFNFFEDKNKTETR